MKQKMFDLLDSKAKYFCDIADYIWDNPELGFVEHKSAKALMDALEENGFAVEAGLAGMPTAFKGVFGSGHPVIGFLGEYDALAGLSQKDGCLVEEPIEAGKPGHGCGHNAIATACLASAVALKAVMEENNLPGTLIVYGCPAEEQGSGKAFMARDGVFNEMDVAIAPHPSDSNNIMGVSALSNVQVEYKFKGKASHAAAVPHLGRSALDACTLMITGVQFLREHIIQEARIHHAYLNTGGTSPNVVQADASLLFFIRAPKAATVKELYEKVNNIAKGAALMTDTSLEIEMHAGITDLVVNEVLGNTMAEAWAEVGPQNFSEEAIAAAKAFAPAVPGCDVENPLNNNVPTFKKLDVAMPGSTDVGDASYVAPTVMMMHGGLCKGTPGHSWQMVAQTRSVMMHEGMMHASKVMAVTALKLLQDPSIVEAAIKEHNDNGVVYESLMPNDLKPKLDRK